jgi:NAD(P)-dependent dehydrogenase (short-subunit alcohol dehydrogenase family)
MLITSQIAPHVLGGKLALVTGAGQGNGRAISKGLAQAGARVVVTDIHGENAKAVAKEITDSGGQAWHYVLDVTSESECQALAALVANDVGHINVLVNNAGIIIQRRYRQSKSCAKPRAHDGSQCLGNFQTNPCIFASFARYQRLHHQLGIHCSPSRFARHDGVFAL